MPTQAGTGPPGAGRAPTSRRRARGRTGRRSTQGAELGGPGEGFVGNLGYWVDLVRVPPSGTWERRRADRLALAEPWVGPEDATEAEGLAYLVRAYLRAFGPAPYRDIGAWAGIPATAVRAAAAHLDLVRHRGEDGRIKVEPYGPIPPAARDELEVERLQLETFHR